ncbi:hypothetical protein [Nonomuraea sp. NPDC049758]|uniref:hypothetical protein n=1 Tax=Nonomuraea sp. NPDC049758 TaxID=3154360 RepID=UPI00344761A4
MGPFTALLIAAALVAVLHVAVSRNPLTKCSQCAGSGLRPVAGAAAAVPACTRCRRLARSGAGSKHRHSESETALEDVTPSAATHSERRAVA